MPWLNDYKALVQADLHIREATAQFVSARSASTDIVKVKPEMRKRLREAMVTMEDFRSEIYKTTTMLEQLNDASGEGGLGGG